MESKRFITEEEKQKALWAQTQEGKSAISEKVNSFLTEDSQRIQSEKKIVDDRAKWAMFFGVSIKPKEVAENAIDKAYSKVFRDKSLGKSQKTKRAASFNEKERRQNLVNSEMSQYHTVRDRAVNMIAEDSIAGESQEEFLESKDVKKSKYSEATRDIAVYAYISRQDSIGDMAKKFYKSASSSETEDSAPEYLLREMEKLDLSEFEYESDSEFATDLSLKMAKLRAFSHAEDYLREIKLGRLQIGGEPLDITGLTAKAQMLEAIKTDYENRMLLMESPYYVLLAKKDMDGLSEEGFNDLVDDVKNEELKTYVDAFKKIKANKLFGKGEKVSEKEKKIKTSLEKEGKKPEGEADHMDGLLKEYAKKKGYKFETGHKRAGILAAYYYEKYGEDSATDVRVFINKHTPLLDDKKLSSSQKKKLSQMVADYNETATMLEYIKRQNLSEAKNEKGGAQPSLAVFKDQNFRILASQSPAFRELAEKLQSERDGRAYSRYVSYTDTVLRNVITAPDKTGLFKDRNDSKNSITEQEVYNNEIELIRYKKEKGIDLSDDEKQLLGNTTEINEDAVAQKKKELEYKAKEKLRVVSSSFLNTDKPFIDIERDWMAATESTMRTYKEQNDGLYRKDVAGIDRMEHHAKYKKGGSGMVKAAESDVENLVQGILIDKQLTIPDLSVEEPLLTALKGYMMFMMIGENAIMKKAKEKDLVKGKLRILSAIVDDKTAEDDPNMVELTALRKDMARLEKEESRIGAFSLRFRISVPISLSYLPNVLKLQSYMEARQVILQEEDGAYKQQLLKTLDEKVASLKEVVEENKISAYKTTSNGVPIEITDNQKTMISNLSGIFDTFTELRRRKAEGEDAEDLEDEALEQLENAMEKVMDYNKMEEA